jgi:hypothetical protein
MFNILSLRNIEASGLSLQILKNGYLIHCSHENTINTLKALPKLGEVSTLQIFRRFPKVLMSSTDNMVQIMKHLTVSTFLE